MKSKHSQKILLLFSIFTFFCLQSCIKKQVHTFEISKNSFLLNGKTFLIRSGEMHFERIPREYWQHRLQMAKAMGLNTISTYLFWNKIEPKENEFDKQCIKDMVDFCQLAQKEGLWVIMRPGPYVCAEWDMGGLPWWLLKDRSMKVRSCHPYFLDRAQKYLSYVCEAIQPLQITQGGPIIMVQVENEYGHYGNDKEYLGKIKEYIQEKGIDVPLYQCDYYTRLKDVRDDLFCTVNFGTKEDPAVAFDSLRKVMPEGPLMVSEYYPGWLDHWGDKHGVISTNAVIHNLTYFLENNCSFNFYMLHGGTSFGLWSGANHPEDENGNYQPQTTSYDYDAPISEAGWDTPKYHSIRETIQRYLPNEKLPQVPKRYETMNIPAFKLTESASVMDNLTQAIKDSIPQSVEMYNQGFGFIVYTTNLPKGSDDSLFFEKISDFAIVMLDKKIIATLDRRKKEFTCKLPKRNKDTQLSIIVEAMGRVNADKHIQDYKGIVGEVKLRNKQISKNLRHWEVHPVKLENNQEPQGIHYQEAVASETPSFYKGYFNVSNSKDTFLDVSNWGKGIVWVNGRCLGRFWNIGPTQTMYLPAPWIKEGENEVVVLDFLKPNKLEIQGHKVPILDKLNKQPTH